MLLEVSTSDESCLRVCVRLREASARARVSSTGRMSHVSHPTHPATPQPTAAAGGTADPILLAVGGGDGFSDLTTGGTAAEVDDGTETGFDDAEAALAAAARSEGDGALDGGGVGNVWRRGAFNMADKPVDEEVLDSGAAELAEALLVSADDVEEDVRLLVDEVDG